MYSYITNLSADRKFSQTYVFPNKYSCAIKRKSQSLSYMIKYKPSINISFKVNNSIEKTFKPNKSMDYLSLNKNKVHIKGSSTLNKLKIRSVIMRKSLILENPKKLLNKFLI
jgi:hypothetical protein